jgi:hypothetical protein
MPQIPLTEFALNSSINNLSGFAPFELNYGYMPRLTPFPTHDELELSEELKARRIHPCFHVSLLRPFEPNNDTLFLGWESKWFYNFGMPDDDEWLIDEIMGHRFVGKSIKFNVRWTAGDHTWEPYAHVKDLEALDHYYALMGVAHWQSLAKRATIVAVDGSSRKQVWGSIKEK